MGTAWYNSIGRILATLYGFRGGTTDVANYCCQYCVEKPMENTWYNGMREILAKLSEFSRGTADVADHCC